VGWLSPTRWRNLCYPCGWARWAQLCNETMADAIQHQVEVPEHGGVDYDVDTDAAAGIGVAGAAAVAAAAHAAAVVVAS
jgi:hypothetical protein